MGLFNRNKDEKKIGMYLTYNDTSKKLSFKDNHIKMKHGVSLAYNQIQSFELIVDDESITKGGLGSAALGGLALGGIGVITGAILGRKNKQYINQMYFKIIDTDKNIYKLPIIQTKTKADSSLAKVDLKNAEEISEKLEYIVLQNN